MWIYVLKIYHGNTSIRRKKILTDKKKSTICSGIKITYKGRLHTHLSVESPVFGNSPSIGYFYIFLCFLFFSLILFIIQLGILNINPFIYSFFLKLFLHVSSVATKREQRIIHENHVNPGILRLRGTNDGKKQYTGK